MLCFILKKCQFYLKLGVAFIKIFGMIHPTLKKQADLAQLVEQRTCNA